LSNSEIVDEFATFFIAGMDTTGHLLTMVLYYLDKYPAYKQKVKEEVDKVFKDGTLFDHDLLNEMHFTNAFLKETLRLATPAPFIFQRIAVQDHKLGDVFVKKGTWVNVGISLTNFNEKFNQNAYEFNPYRWMEKSATEKSDPYVFIPFSSGQRNCIGQHLALNETKIILGLFLKRFDYKVPEDYQLKMIFRFLMEPLNPLMVDLKPIKRN